MPDSHQPNAAITATSQVQDTYYGIPPIRAPHWSWLVISYFFLGGMAGEALPFRCSPTWCPRTATSCAARDMFPLPR